jgi:hypothetical protein
MTKIYQVRILNFSLLQVRKDFFVKTFTFYFIIIVFVVAVLVVTIAAFDKAARFCLNFLEGRRGKRKKLRMT